MYIKGWLFNGAVMSNDVGRTGVSNQDLIALAERVPPNTTVNGTSQSNNSSTSLKSNDIFSRAAALSNPITPNSNIEEIQLTIEQIAFGEIDITIGLGRLLSLYFTKGNGTDISQYSDLQNPNTAPLIASNEFVAVSAFQAFLQAMASKVSEISDFLQYNEGQKWFTSLKEKARESFDFSKLPSETLPEFKSFLEKRNLKTNGDALVALRDYAREKRDYKAYSLITGLSSDILIAQVRELLSKLSTPLVSTAKALWDTNSKRLNDLVTNLVGGRQNG